MIGAAAAAAAARDLVRQSALYKPQDFCGNGAWLSANRKRFRVTSLQLLPFRIFITPTPRLPGAAPASECRGTPRRRVPRRSGAAVAVPPPPRSPPLQIFRGAALQVWVHPGICAMPRDSSSGPSLGTLCHQRIHAHGATCMPSTVLVYIASLQSCTSTVQACWLVQSVRRAHACVDGTVQAWNRACKRYEYRPCTRCTLVGLYPHRASWQACTSLY